MSTTSKTIDRAEINRRNARKSTGPRTPEGKDRSRFNALKHGMTAKTLVLPGEDAGVLQQRIDAWTADLQPRNEVEQFLVERSVLSSWQLERADRAEHAQLSSRMRAVPDEDAGRHREEVAALGRLLCSDHDFTLDDSIQSQVLSALIPGGKSKTASRAFDVLDHPEAIVLRLESTDAGCRWMLDRWTELRGRLDRGHTWQTDEKVKAIRLLGKRPLDMNPEQWEDHLDIREEIPDPEGDAYFDRRLDRQLDDRLAADQSATVAELRDVAGRAIARLEELAAGYRERAEADAAERAARLSFDPGNEAERLRRYQSSCGRALYRSLDALLKIRRNNLGEARGERTDGDEEIPSILVEAEALAWPQNLEIPVLCDDLDPIVSPEVPPESNGHAIADFTAEDGETTATKAEERGERKDEVEPVVESREIVERAIENEPTPARMNPRKSRNAPPARPVDRENRGKEPKDQQVAGIPQPRSRRHGAVASAMVLLVLFGAAGRDPRDSQNEPSLKPPESGGRTSTSPEPTQPGPAGLVSWWGRACVGPQALPFLERSCLELDSTDAAIALRPGQARALQTMPWAYRLPVAGRIDGGRMDRRRDRDNRADHSDRSSRHVFDNRPVRLREIGGRTKQSTARAVRTRQHSG
jgi:hypothetical protein